MLSLPVPAATAAAGQMDRERGLALRQRRAQGREWTSQQGPPARVLTPPRSRRGGRPPPCCPVSWGGCPGSGMSPSAPAPALDREPTPGGGCCKRGGSEGRPGEGRSEERAPEPPQELTSREAARGRRKPTVTSTDVEKTRDKIPIPSNQEKTRLATGAAFSSHRRAPWGTRLGEGGTGFRTRKEEGRWSPFADDVVLCV